MKPKELLKKAIAAGVDGFVTLNLPGLPTGRQRRLCGAKGGPLGEVLCCPSTGGTTVRFEAKKVVLFLVGKGLVLGEEKDAALSEEARS